MNGRCSHKSLENLEINLQLEICLATTRYKIRPWYRRSTVIGLRNNPGANPVVQQVSRENSEPQIRKGEDDLAFYPST